MEITVKNDSPLIKINFNTETGDLFLEYKGIDILLDFGDGRGSIARIFQLDEPLTLNRDLIESARDFLNSTKADETFISNDMIELFSGIFESGEYQIGITEIKANEHSIIEPDENYYPFEVEQILLTQSPIGLSKNTIKKYEKKLSENLKPLILAVQYGFIKGYELIQTPLIILDGHHKFEAYRKKGIVPKFLLFYRKEIMK